MMGTIINVCPRIEDLEKKAFRHKTKIKNLVGKKDSQGVMYQYHCPFQRCKYSASCYFSSFKFLRQHYRKMHAEKKFICPRCSKRFALESLLRTHSDICGTRFFCSCSGSFSTLEALMMHLKRKCSNSGFNVKSIKMAVGICKYMQSQTSRLDFREDLPGLAIPSCSAKSVTENNSELYQAQADMDTDQVNSLGVSKHTQTNIETSKISSETQTHASYKRSVSLQTFEASADLDSVINDNLSKFGDGLSVGYGPSQEKSEECMEPDKYLNLDISDHPQTITDFTSGDLLLTGDPNFGSAENYQTSEERNKLCTTETQTEMSVFDGLIDSLLCSEAAFTSYLDSETQTGFSEYLERTFADMHTQTNDSLLSDFGDLISLL